MPKGTKSFVKEQKISFPSKKAKEKQNTLKNLNILKVFLIHDNNEK